MSRYLIIAALAVGCCAALGCKSYTEGLEQHTKGLQQGVARADETAAIGALHTILVAQRTYTVSNNGSYGTFAQLVQGGYLDVRFNSERPTVKGYVLTMTVSKEGSAEPSYSVNADPEGSGPQAAGRHFYLDSAGGLIRVNASQAATASDQLAEQ